MNGTGARQKTATKLYFHVTIAAETMKIDIGKESLQILLDKISKSDYIVGIGESKSHLKALEEFIKEHNISNVYVCHNKHAICGRRCDLVYVGALTHKYLREILAPIISAKPRQNWVEILDVK